MWTHYNTERRVRPAATGRVARAGVALGGACCSSRRWSTSLFVLRADFGDRHGGRDGPAIAWNLVPVHASSRCTTACSRASASGRRWPRRAGALERRSTSGSPACCSIAVLRVWQPVAGIAWSTSAAPAGSLDVRADGCRRLARAPQPRASSTSRTGRASGRRMPPRQSASRTFTTSAALRPRAAPDLPRLGADGVRRAAHDRRPRWCSRSISRRIWSWRFRWRSARSSQTFGDEYRRYMQRVRWRMLPGVY